MQRFIESIAPKLTGNLIDLTALNKHQNLGENLDFFTNAGVKEAKRPGFSRVLVFFFGNFKLIIKNMINDVFIKLGLAKRTREKKS